MHETQLLSPALSLYLLNPVAKDVYSAIHCRIPPRIVVSFSSRKDFTGTSHTDKIIMLSFIQLRRMRCNGSDFNLLVRDIERSLPFLQLLENEMNDSSRRRIFHNHHQGFQSLRIRSWKFSFPKDNWAEPQAFCQTSLYLYLLFVGVLTRNSTEVDVNW